MSDDICPWLRGRTLNVSMALATLGLEILRRASITVSSLTGVSKFALRSHGVASLPAEQVAQEVGRLLDLLHVGIDREGPLEIVEGPGRFVQLQVVHAVATQRAEVIGVALDDLVAVGQRLPVFTEQIVGRGTLVPA